MHHRACKFLTWACLHVRVGVCNLFSYKPIDIVLYRLGLTKEQIKHVKAHHCESYKPILLKPTSAQLNSGIIMEVVDNDFW